MAVFIESLSRCVDWDSCLCSWKVCCVTFTVIAGCDGFVRLIRLSCLVWVLRITPFCLDLLTVVAVLTVLFHLYSSVFSDSGPAISFNCISTGLTYIGSEDKVGDHLKSVCHPVECVCGGVVTTAIGGTVFLSVGRSVFPVLKSSRLREAWCYCTAIDVAYVEGGCTVT